MIKKKVDILGVLFLADHATIYRFFFNTLVSGKKRAAVLRLVY